jgi:hypothetical protein
MSAAVRSIRNFPLMLMRLNLRRVVLASLAAAAVAMTVGTALASSLPTLYCNLKERGPAANRSFTPVFSVRPRHVGVLNTQQGGELTLKWSSWTLSSATGSGTALPGIAVSPGQKQPTYKVAVKAYRVIDGHFTRMTIITDVSGTRTQAEHLHLAESSSSGGTQFAWVTKS